MNEQLQLALADILNKTVTVAENASSFVIAELPDVITQLLTWYAVKSLITLSLMLILAIAWLVLDFKAFKFCIKVSIDAVVGGWLLLGSLIRVPLILFISSNTNLDFLQIWLAPKIWLIEYSANLVK